MVNADIRVPVEKFSTLFGLLNADDINNEIEHLMRINVNKDEYGVSSEDVSGINSEINSDRHAIRFLLVDTEMSG